MELYKDVLVIRDRNGITCCFSTTSTTTTTTTTTAAVTTTTCTVVIVEVQSVAKDADTC